jgi:hypothetical protein
VRVRWAIAATACAMAGFGLGRWLHPDATSPGPVIPAEVIVPASVAEAGDPCDQLAIAEALRDRTREDIEGVPEPFPEGDPDVGPAAFRADLAEAQRLCPDMAVDHVDCDEYPCLAWVRDPCDAAADVMEIPTYETLRDLTLGDGARGGWRLVSRSSEAHPPAQADFGKSTLQGNSVRMETRVRAAETAIMAKTGARVMTDRELALQQIADVEEMLRLMDENHANGREFGEDMLAKARAELARLDAQR